MDNTVRKIDAGGEQVWVFLRARSGLRLQWQTDWTARKEDPNGEEVWVII